MNTTPTLADMLAELRLLRAEVRELRQQADSPTHSSARLVDAATLADELGVTRHWVYQHRQKLGAVRIGDGPKARLRFDVGQARRALAAADDQPQAITTLPRPKRVNRIPAGSILQIRS